MMKIEWRGFKGNQWQSEVNLRDFVQNNYTSYDGDESFLAEPTQATNTLWGMLKELQKEERAKGGVLDMETEVVSGLTAYGAAYIGEGTKELEKVVGLQTDKPLKRAFMPYGGIKMAEQACTTYGYQPSEKLHEIFHKYCKTHNDGVFDAYTPEMKLVRHNHILTGLPDTYGRGRIVGDYRRVALYGIDFLIKEKQNDLANMGDREMIDEVIRLREEVSMQIKALKGLKEMAQLYGYDISQPAKNAREAVQWLYFGYLGAVKFRENLPFYSGVACFEESVVLVPSHCVDEVLGTGEHRCEVVAQQVVASVACACEYAARHGEQFTVVVARHLHCYESAALCRALHEYACVAHSCHDAVSSHEVALVGFGVCHVFGEQCAVPYHLRCYVAVCGGIYGVESVCKHSHCVESVVESLAVCRHIHAVCQSAHDDGVGAQLPQVGDEPFQHVARIDRCAPCADDAHYMRCVQVCRAAAEQHHGGVVARTEALRIVVVIEQERLYGVLHVELHLLLGVCHAVVYVVQGIDECFGRIGEHPLYVAAVLHHGCGGAETAVQPRHGSRAEASCVMQGCGV